MNALVNQIMVDQIEERLVQGGIHRIVSCVERLNEDQLNFRPNSNSNSINNQILHLDGNVRQWLISSILDIKDERDRDAEFDPENKQSKEELLGILNQLEVDVKKTYKTILTRDLTERKEVQCYTESLLSIIVHVIEHFNYHHGQITYITKMLLDIDTGYYAGQDLNKVN